MGSGDSLEGVRGPSPRLRRLGTATAVAAALLTAGILPAAGASAGAVTASHSGPPVVAYQGHAFGTAVNVASGTLESGDTANIVTGCTETPAPTRTNSTVGVSVPGVLSAGAVTTSLTANRTGTTKSEVATADVATVSLLGGMVSAQAVTASSTSSLTGDTFSTSGSSDLVGLSVDGMSEPASVPANTTIPLPGVGSVILNQQDGSTSSDSAALVVTAIDIKVLTSNSFGLPVGAQVIVARGNSALVGAVSAVVGGDAYGTSADVAGGTVISGPTAFQPLACLGTDGTVDTNTTAGVTIPDVLSTGTVTSSAEGDVVAHNSTANTSDTVENLSLIPSALSSLVTVDAVTAEAHASKVGGAIALSETGSTFVGLSVTGFPSIANPVPENTTIPIPGVGTLYLNRVIQTTNGIDVRMNELDVTGSGLPVPAGTDLIVANAQARVG